jgi:hypothetical protein
VKIPYGNHMEGTQKQIYDQLLRWGRGRIFVAQDFTMLGTPESVRQALSTLTDERIILRIAHGVYCFPKVEGEYSIRTIYPSAESIAEAIAEKSRCRIVPYGDQAAYLVGFTGLQIGRHTYLTDGAPRVIHTNHTTITFRHTSEMRIFSFKNRTMQLISLGIRAVGKDGITPDIRETIKERISKVPKDDLEHDIKLCPGWVSDLLFEL